jgi:methyl-accepting chemotaxis protein
MRYNRFTLGTRLTLSFGALTVMLALMAWSALSTVSVANSLLATTVTSSARKLELARNMNTAKSNMAAAQRGVVLFTYSKSPELSAAAKRLFSESIGRFTLSLAEIRPLLVTERAKRSASAMEGEIFMWQAAYSEMERVADAGNPDGATRILTDKIIPLSVAAGTDCDVLIASVDEVFKSDQEAGAKDFAPTKWITLLLTALGLAIAAAAFGTVRSAILKLRQFTVELLAGSRQVAAASGQVASANQSLAQGTSEQAATLEETAASTTEIAAITRQNADNTRTVAGLMEETAQRVGDANHNLEEMVQSMKEINTSSERISKIIRVIDEIAFQTNILALNAAVEAARAGEAGMGFAVVADEVRNLAHRCAQAAKDTAALIEESIAKSHEGSKKLQQVATSIHQITGSATQVKTLVDEVNVGSQEQSRGIDQIATAVNQMEQVTQRSAANAEESGAASEELAAQAQSLYAIVERMRKLVGGSANGALPKEAGNPAALLGPPSMPDPVRIAFGKSLRAAEALVPVAAVRITNREFFPLDENENGF